MASEADKPAPEAVPDDGIPVLHEIVRPGDEPVLPVLDPNEVVVPQEEADGNGGLSAERLAELADTLQLTLSRELDYAIDGAVYERFQHAMEEVAASVKKKVQAQLEQKLPELIEQSLGKQP
jgi:hypothetical protein